MVPLLKLSVLKNFFKVLSTIIGVLVIGLILVECEFSPKQTPPKKELLIYCGITMIAPMLEIADIIEEQEDCKITITKGGSGNLLNSIYHNKTGDLYLPGSCKYYTMIEDKQPDLVLEKVTVGHNVAVMMVQKGNPKCITSDLSNMTDRDLVVEIGNPESGSIGKETKKILQAYGNFEDVVINAIRFTTDSKELLNALKSKELDLVINWYATYTWGDNSDYLDVIKIDSTYAHVNHLELSILKYSKYPDIAKAFMTYASSEKGKDIFKKYGLYFD